MAVSEVTQALGAWSITLRADTPRSVLDAIGYFGHVAITMRRSEATAQGDQLLTAARYVGVVRNITRSDLTQNIIIGGSGMAFWLGDENDVGAVYVDPVTLAGANFASTVAALLPSTGAVTTGTIGGVAGILTQTFQWTSPRTALTTACALFSSGTTAAETVEWRVNGNATLDAGPLTSLYVTNPTAAIVRRNPGADMTVRSLPGSLQNAQDMRSYATTVALLAAGTSGSTAVGLASLPTVPYQDLHGNQVNLVKMVSQSDIAPPNAVSQALGILNASATPASALVLSTTDFDVRGTVATGDYVWVQDPDAGLVDYSQEIHLRGDVLNPVLLRVVELDWPVTAGMGAAYRGDDGGWTDLSDYLVYESGATNVIVGALSSPLISGAEPIGSRPIADASIPGAPVFGAEATSVYLGPSDGKTKAQIQVTWSTPLNTDGSTIIDGDHYEIRYQPDLTPFTTNPTWAELNTAGYTWAALNSAGATWNQVISPAAAQWHVSNVGWGTNVVLIQELTPGVNYNFQVRAVDTASPPNFGAWSATTVYQASVDTIAPPTPDAPVVAAGLLSVQVTWDCGTSAGGAFTQSVDLNHIELHGSYDPLFAPTSATKLGNVQANIANITGQIPVVATLALPPSLPVAQNVFVKLIAVDNSGNKSLPSASAGVTATLISDQYISNLSVSKLTAGTITAGVILGSTIATAASGGRVALDGAVDQFEVYDNTGTLVATWSPAGLQLLTNPGSGTLTISPNPGTTKSPTLVFSSGLAGIASHGTVHANNGGLIEGMILDGPTSTSDTTASFPRIALYSGSGSGPNLSTGALEYWSAGASLVSPLTWNQYGLYLNQFPVGAVNNAFPTGGRPFQNDDDLFNGTQPFVWHYQQVSATVGASGVVTFSHGAFFTPVSIIVTPVAGFFGYSINGGFGVGGFTSTQAQIVVQALGGGVASNGTAVAFNCWVYA
jgi:hypothetical protein